MHILRKELDEFKECWNWHLIAKSKGASLPTGRPNSLYHLPQLYGTKSYKISVDLADVEEFDNPNFAQNRPDNCEEFCEFADAVLQMRGLSRERPSSVNQDLKIYFALLEDIVTYS